MLTQQVVVAGGAVEVGSEGLTGLGELASGRLGRIGIEDPGIDRQGSRQVTGTRREGQQEPSGDQLRREKGESSLIDVRCTSSPSAIR